MRSKGESKIHTCFKSGSFPLRLAIALCLRCRFQEALAMIAVVCSTWSVVNLGTSQRDFLCPLGQSVIASVRSANRMVSRKGLGGGVL